MFSFFVVAQAYAASATMFLNPSLSSFTVGQNFNVAVKLNTGGDSINAAEGKINYNPQKLSVVELSKTGSVFSLWTYEPANNTSAGVIKFGGGSPNPGFTGSSGNIITVTFKALETGNTSLRFVSGSVLANDGKGTNILGTLGGSEYSIVPSVSVPRPQRTFEEPQSSRSGTSASAPVVASPTHPDPDKWYSKRDAEFLWNIPKNVIKIAVAVNQTSDTVPPTSEDVLISGKKTDILREGIWYIHVQFKNSGGWGETAHFKFNIDSTPPFLDVFDLGYIDDAKTQAQFRVSASDGTSGIDRIETKIDDNNPVKWNDSTVVYGTPYLEEGEHKITVYAYDKAGNFSKEEEMFNISSSASAYSRKPWFEGKTSTLVLLIVIVIFVVFRFYDFGNKKRK